ncbi:divisome protein SepX/GlpR [Actinopolymorpha pittospori]
MGTGLIYAAIVAAWAAYLVPLWLRRHDEAAAARSVNGVSTAMRVLARRRVPVRAPSGDGQVVGPPPRTARPGVGPSAAARRRRTLVALVCMTTLVAILATVGALPWGNLVIPLVLIAGFLVVSASAARRERLVRPVAPQAAAPREGARVEASSAWASAHGGQSYRLAGQQNPARVGSEPAADRGFAAAGDPNRPAELRVDDASDGGEVAQPAASAAERPVAGTRAPSGDLWDPVEVPLPTYVTKAKAPRTVRTVDLADQGTWTTARLPEAGMLSRPEDASAMLLDETGHNEPGTGRESGKRDGSDGDQRRAVGD